MNPIINICISVFLMMVCCATTWAQNEMVVEYLEKNKKWSISFYQNDVDDEFNAGITVAENKNITFNLKLLLDDDFANDFETYSLRDFFVMDFNLVKSLGCLDIFLSIENALNFGDNEITNEPVLAQNNNISYLREFEHDATFVAMLGISYTF